MPPNVFRKLTLLTAYQQVKVVTLLTETEPTTGAGVWTPGRFSNFLHHTAVCTPMLECYVKVSVTGTG